MVTVVNEEREWRERGSGIHNVHRAALNQPSKQRSGWEPGEAGTRVGEVAQKTEAEGFAGAGLRRAEMKIGSGEEVVMTLGTGAPESENGELVIVAYEIAADEGGDIVEYFRAGDGSDLGVASRFVICHESQELVLLVLSV